MATIYKVIPVPSLPIAKLQYWLWNELERYALQDSIHIFRSSLKRRPL